MTDSFQAALASFQRKNSSHSKTQNRRPDAGNEGENRVSISRAQFSVDDSIGNSYSLRLVNHQVKVHVFIHAKNPEQVSSEWVKSCLLPYSRRPRWGSIEITRAMVDLLEAALANTEVSRMILLSESCIPIVPMKEVLFQLWREEKSWINFRTAPDNGYDRDQKWGRVSAAVSIDCICKADQWTCLIRSHAEDIVSLPHIARLDIWPLFKDTVASDELYVPTLLRILGEIPKEGESDTVNRRCVTWADWTTSPKHPATFESLAACRGWPADAIEKGCLFARKFQHGSVSQEAWDDLIEKRVTTFEKILADMPKDTRKLAEETIAGRSSSTTENISTRHHPSLAHDVGGPYLPGHFTGPSWLQSSPYLLPNERVVMDEQVNRRKRSRDEEDRSEWQKRTGNRRGSWNELTSRRQVRGWDREERGRSRGEWSSGPPGNSYERGYDVDNGYNHLHIDHPHHYHRSRISDRQGGSKENRRSTRGGEFETRTRYHHDRSQHADDYYRDDIDEGDSYHNRREQQQHDVSNTHQNNEREGTWNDERCYDIGTTLNDQNHDSTRKDGRGYYNYSKRHETYDNIESVVGDTKRRKYSDDQQPTKQQEHCPPGALAWVVNDPPGTTPEPFDEYHSGGGNSATGKRSKERNLPPPTNDDGGSLAASSSVWDTTTTITENQLFNGSGAAAEECHEEELEIVRVEPHKANQKPFACDGW